MRIVVLDGYTENPGDLSWNGLAQLGELTVYDRTAYTASPLIAQRIGQAEIVVTNKTPISRDTLSQCPNVQLIAVIATGYNVVDCAAARERGIPVVNVPDYGTEKRRSEAGIKEKMYWKSNGKYYLFDGANEPVKIGKREVKKVCPWEK